MSHFKSHIEQIFATLRDEQALRTFTPIELLERGRYTALDGAHPQSLINLDSNDYPAFHDASCHFADEADLTSNLQALSAGGLGSTSSRLFSGDRAIMHQLEGLITEPLQHETVLLFNSGYRANVGILPALRLPSLVVIADKLIHASMVDGLRLSGLPLERFRHNDVAQLQRLIEKHHSARGC